MKRDDSITFFKRKAYYCICIYKKIEELKNEIEELDYRITGVTGIDLTASRGSGRQEDRDLHRLKLMNKKDILETRLAACHEYISWIHEIVRACSREYRPYIVETYLRRKRVDNTAAEAGIPVSVLSRRMSAELKRALTIERIERMNKITEKLGESNTARKSMPIPANYLSNQVLRKNFSKQKMTPEFFFLLQKV